MPSWSSAYLDNVLKKLSRCDLLIDATANPKVFNLLAAVATTNTKPLVWMEVFAGGIGGMIARSRPGQDPDPYLMRSAYYDYLASEAPPLENSFVDSYRLENSDGEILSASDAEVSILAGHATRLALDTLLGENLSSYPYSMYLIGLESAWIFKAPFHTIPIATNHLLQQPITNSVAPEILSDNIAFLTELLEKRNDADSPA